MTAAAQDLERVARELWGEPNHAMSNRRELRFGNKGSRSVDLIKIRWFDHEAGEGGGYPELYKLKHGTFPPNGRDDSAPSIVAIYDYRDESGDLLFQVVRKPGHKFVQRCPDPGAAGGWQWSTKGVRRVLYQLPELLAADPGRMVFVAEGEKDVGNLCRRGLVATCNPGGAGKWVDSYAQALAGREVVVLPDNDKPGRDHAQTVVATLHGVARSVRVLMLPGLPAKGDVSDWLAAGGTAEALERLVAEAPLEQRQPEPEPSDDDEDENTAIARLARLKPLAYERVRLAEAERLHIRAGFLDRLVKAERGDGGGPVRQGRPVEFPAPETWPDPVDGAALLADLTVFFSTHLFAPARVPNMLALWALHTWCFDKFRFTPRLNFRSVTKRSGKSTALDLLQMVVAKPLRAENISPAATFRVTEIAAPTLLIDEADRFLPENNELIGMLNAGYARGGQAVRCVGEDSEARQFTVFAPAVIAGIGNLPGTLADRAIIVPMVRATRAEQEQTRPVGDDTEAKGVELARRAARWAMDNARRLAGIEPDMGGLFARFAQVWKPLYVLADAAGENWPGLVRQASAALTVEDDDAEQLSIKLLADVRAVFETAELPALNKAAGVSSGLAEDEAMARREMLSSKAFKEAIDGIELPTAELVAALHDMAERPWPEMPRTGKALTAAAFTRLLKPFKVERKKLREGEERAWGYRRVDFADAWRRYLHA